MFGSAWRKTEAKSHSVLSSTHTFNEIRRESIFDCINYYDALVIAGCCLLLCLLLLLAACNNIINQKTLPLILINKMKLSLTILALAAASASAAVPSLTPDNYDSITDGKTVFIKFFAPW